MNRMIFGAALAAAISLGGTMDAGAQTLGDRVRRAERSQEESRERDRRENDQWENDRWENDRRLQDRRDRYDSRIYSVRLDEYLRGISLNRGQRNRVERAWNTRGSREQRLRVVRSQLPRTQQRRFDYNVAQIERRYDRYDSNGRRW